ncbi:MAG: hypothetical protein JSV10_08715 [Candidatus Zixiibacteriota bacterium]|nr:MAG: hypothetical protein JSV10_08715 [candidate division Zixibacteria bacterium]
MKSRLLLLLIMAVVMCAMIAADYGTSFAYAKAKASSNRTYARTTAEVEGGPFDEDQMEQTGANTTSTASAFSSNARGSWAQAQATATNIGRLYEYEHERRHLMPGDWGSTKGDSLVSEIAFECTLSVVAPQQAVLRTVGTAKLFPMAGSGENASVYRVAVTDSTQATCFVGAIIVDGASVQTSGDYQDDVGIATQVVADTFFVTVDRPDTMAFAGSDTLLELSSTLTGHSSGPPIPTTTEWGLIVLVTLLALSAVFIWLRKRRVSVSL